MHQDKLSLAFAALADPTRRALLQRLSEGEASVSELAEPFAISLPAISRHLKVLENSGLIARARNAQSRPAKIKPEALRDATRWLDQYRRFWDASFDRLDDYLRQVGS